jgi:hypothetical protein
MLFRSLLCLALLLLFSTRSFYAQIRLPKIKTKSADKVVEDVLGTGKKNNSKDKGSTSSRPAASKDNEYTDITPQEIEGKWAGRLDLNPGRDIIFEMRIAANGNKITAEAEYITAYGHMRYLLEGQFENGKIELYEKEVLEQGPGTDPWILSRKKYLGGFVHYNGKLQFKGKYEPDGQYYYKDKKPVPANILVRGNDFKLIKVDEEKIAREFADAVYTPDKNQDEYLRKMLLYFADNKYFNYHRKSIPSSLRYYIIARDKEGFFTKVLGKYFEQTQKGEPVNQSDSMEILVQFDKGIPYRIGYPLAEKLPEVSPLTKGEIGSLQYPDDAKKRAIALFIADNKVRDSIFEENRKRSVVDIEKKLLKYGTHNCQTCFEKASVPETYEYEVTDYDEKGQPYTTKKQGYTNIISYTNTCNQVITVVGVAYVLTSNRGPYYVDISFSLKPKEIISFDQNGIGAMIGAFVNVTSLEGKINPGLRQQYLRIVGKNKPK